MAALAAPGGPNGNFILLLIVISQEFTAIIIFQIITFFNYKMALISLAHAWRFPDWALLVVWPGLVPAYANMVIITMWPCQAHCLVLDCL